MFVCERSTTGIPIHIDISQRIDPDVRLLSDVIHVDINFRDLHIPDLPLPTEE
ncbi:MAG: hypothetical protein KAR65_00915 [Anaerolineales bacterium]|nr:hypothetical protein [Anaerolineales bacterium]MCK5634861.1 hypothetical protein [Anaerolineales bacterium]